MIANTRNTPLLSLDCTGKNKGAAAEIHSVRR